ncbi:hypothetical protein CJF42_17300, partial [Pseudoalteromonas sp. NBT06-2]|uniref:FimV/HubP family polar landmark protein n=1 Tax=Pseudoalteromonas sp. NBT06-2 TaxID=2025950 RepID=UPI000BC543C3
EGASVTEKPDEVAVDDDIDALLEGTSVTEESDEVAAAADIDALLNEVASEESSSEGTNQFEVQDEENDLNDLDSLDDIDALLESDLEELTEVLNEPEFGTEIAQQEDVPLETDLSEEKQALADDEFVHENLDNFEAQLNSSSEDLEIDLGDNPLLESDDFDLSTEDESFSEERISLEQQHVDSPSEELEEYPELALDDALAEIEANEGPIQLSQAEIELAESMRTQTSSNDIEDDFGLKEEVLDSFSLIEDDDLDSVEDDEDLFKLSSNDSKQGDDLQQLEAELMSTDQNLSEPNVEQEINEVEMKLESLLDEDSNDALLEEQNDPASINESLSDLDNTDFDSLLNELAEPEDLTNLDSQEFEIDFDSLLSEENTLENAIEIDDDLELENTLDGDSDFLNITDLIEESDDIEPIDEPYDNIDMDVGLSEFDELLAGEDSLDVDAQNGGYSAKLDLALAYIEIEDFESAAKAIQDVINNGPPEVQREAEQLKKKIKL